MAKVQNAVEILQKIRTASVECTSVTDRQTTDRQTDGQATAYCSLKMTRPNFMKYSVHVNCGHGLILLWWQCNTLCISHFVDDIMFSCNGSYGTWCWQYRHGRSAQASSQNFPSICQMAPCCLPFSSYTTAVNNKCDAYYCLVPASNNTASQKSLSTYHWLERQRRFLTHQMLHIFQQFIIK